MLRMQQYILVDQVYKVITVRVSLERFDDFLRNTRLLDRVSLGGSRVDGTPAKAEETDDTDISIRDCDFVWSKAEGSDESSTDKSFRLTVGSLKFPLGQTTIISGSTGSGKSSLLM
jgi:ABC-type bacteriocin/lantibiotic exporter with double-glycine peptidase domain